MIEQEQSLEYEMFIEKPLFPIKPDQRAYIALQYTRFLKQDHPVLSDMTWNDLDMDELYTQINKTSSGAGDWLLYAMMRQPCINQEELEQRSKLIQWAKNHPQEREKAITILSKVGKRYRDHLDQPYFQDDFQIKPRYFPYVIWVILLVSGVFTVFVPSTFFLFLVSICMSGFYYFYHHKKLEHQLDPLVYLVDHIEALHGIAKIPLSNITEVQEELRLLSKQLSSLRRNRSLRYFEDTAGYFNPITQKEVRLYRKYALLLHEHKDEVMQAISIVGKMDAAISIASYALRTHANESITWTNSSSIIAKDMIHPMVKDCIANDVNLEQNMILTGSNATGKSTYLKMIASNAIIVQCFGFVFAASYVSDFFRIETSMSIHDHLEKGESTFVAEGKALKYLLDAGTSELPALCIMDEILRGTNTLDRISLSAVILREFSKKHARCVVATHDIELTQLLKQWYVCAHFSERMQEGKMVFDYRLQQGVTATRNAIDLLEVFDYEQSLVQAARKRLKIFEATGVWETIV